MCRQCGSGKGRLPDRQYRYRATDTIIRRPAGYMLGIAGGRALPGRERKVTLLPFIFPRLRYTHNNPAAGRRVPVPWVYIAAI